MDGVIGPRWFATRSGETGDKTVLDRVLADGEDDRDRRSCTFGRDRGHVAECRDDCHLSANQISQQSWKTIVLALQPVVLDADVLSFDVAGFVEGFAERSHITRVGFGRPVSDKRDHRQRWLLRTRYDRPRRYCTTNKTYERASPHSRPEARHVMVANCDNAREGVDVRFGSKADICSAATHVRFTPNSDIDCAF